jgi:signal transduction histidine kinase
LERIEMARYEPDRTATVIGASGDHPFPPGSRWTLDGPSLLLHVRETGRPARIDDYGSLSGTIATVAHDAGFRSAIGAPIIVDGRTWGAIIAISTEPEPIPERSEARLAQFTDLIATAVSNATASTGLTALADEQAALRRVATLVARGAPPTEIFRAVAEEVGGLLGPDHAVMARFDAPDVVTIMAEWTSTGDPPRLESRRPLQEGGIAKLVQDTGHPVRVDDYVSAAHGRQSWVLDSGTRAAVAAPITVDGRLWGVMGVGSRGAPPPSGTEERLAGFTELVATAIANTQAREELRTIGDEQAALRRVATLVAESAPGPAVFAAVAEEVGRLLPAERTFLAQFDADDVVTIVGAWPDSDRATALGSHGHLDEAGLSRQVRATNRPARVDRTDATWAALPSVRRFGLRSAVAAPISVQARIWGMIEVASTSDEPVAPGTEERLAGFSELVATAIANSQARGELSALADEQAALRRVATLVAEGAPPDTVFAAVTAEGGRLFGAQCGLLRYDPEGIATIVGLTDIAEAPAVGTQVPLGGHNATTLVFESGRPARIDSFAGDDSNLLSVMGRTVGRSAVGAPIHVAGRLWGVVALNSQRGEPFAQDTEARLEGFAELVATAIANADARAELTASRARVIATADETRRRIERDLHDGAQQRLVAIGLQLRAAQSAVPPELGELAAELERVVAGLMVAQEELREYVRGIHPAVLVKGGLAPALKALARRSTVPVELEVHTAARLPERIELGAYYVISEALTNAAKHANAARVDIAVEEADGLLRLVVRDDGIGGARFVPGSGLVGLKDRVAALGGRLSVESPPGGGTTLEVEIPLAGGSSP